MYHIIYVYIYIYTYNYVCNLISDINGRLSCREAWRGGIHPFEEFLQVFTPQLGAKVRLKAVPQVTKPWENIGDYGKNDGEL